MKRTFIAIYFIILCSGTLSAQNQSFASLEEALKYPEQAVELDLSSQNLQALPPSVGKLVNLEALYLSHNHLSSLPESIGNLKKLKWLIIYQNKLVTLPQALGSLEKLEVLNVGKNQLSSLPDQLGKLKILKQLILSQNQLTTLPETIGSLSVLQKLNVESNQLTSLPASLGKLSQLYFLDLQNNKLKELPASTGNLTKLNKLILSNNQLGSLPATIGKLSELEELVLDKNQISELPEGFYQLQNLKELNLTDNQLTAVSESLGKLKTLQTLQLQVNKLTSLPESVGDLENLETLWLNKNQLTSLPASIGKLSKLQDLRFGYTMMKSIPASVGDLSNLTHLDAQRNQLTSLPESMGNLKQLRYLYLKDNQITQLPESVIALGIPHVDADKHVYYPSRAEIAAKAKEKTQPQAAPKEKEQPVIRQQAVITEAPAKEKHRLYHNVQTDAIRESVTALLRFEPYKSDERFISKVKALDAEIDRYNVEEYISELYYFRDKVNITDELVKAYYLSETEVNDFKNVKHLATHALADIYMSHDEYDKAIEFYLSALQKHEYHSYSGTTINKDRLRIRANLAEAYYGMGKKDEAYIHLIANILNGQGGGNEEMLRLFLEGDDKSKFNKDLEAAARSIKKGSSSSSYSITFRSKKYTFDDDVYAKSEEELKRRLLSLKL